MLALIAPGHNNAEIAQRLTLSPKTVGNYISNIFSKLEVADRARAIIRARDAGLGQAYALHPNALSQKLGRLPPSFWEATPSIVPTEITFGAYDV